MGRWASAVSPDRRVTFRLGANFGGKRFVRPDRNFVTPLRVKFASFDSCQAKRTRWFVGPQVRADFSLDHA